MKNINRIFLVVLAVLVVQGFGGVANAQDCTFVIGPPTESALLMADGDSGSFSVASGPFCYWRPTSVEDALGTTVSWITISGYTWSEGGGGTVNFDVDPNPGFERDGFIVIENGPSFKVRQAGQCSITWVADPTIGTDVFVSYPACSAIVRVGGGVAVPVFFNPGESYQGLVYGPDEMLYALDPIRGLIDIFDPTASDATSPVDTVYDRDADDGLDFDPLFARFNETGSLIVSGKDSAGGFPVLYIFDNDPPRPEEGIYLLGPRHLWSDPLGTGSLGGVMFDADGAILVVNPVGGEVLRFPLIDATNGLYGGPNTLVDSLPPDSLGGSRTSNRDVFVATADGLRRFDQTGSEETACASFAGDGGAVLSTDQSADDTQHLTVWYPTTRVGELREVPFGYNACSDPFTFDCGSTPEILATFSAPTGAGPAVVDVALPFSIRAAAEFSCPDDAGTLINGIKPFDLAGGGQGFNSFDAYLEFIPMDAASTCRVAVSSEEFSPLDIDAVINHPANTLTPSRPLVLPGDNGRMRVWTYTPLDGAVCPPGDPGDPPRYTRNVSAYFKEVNPKLALCHILGLEDCNLQAMRTLDLEFGDLPDDGKLGGFDPRFSEGFLVDQVPDGDYLGTWCGVDPPISNEAPWLSANAGSVVPLDIKPVLADDDPTTDDECGNKTIDALVAVLDIWFIPGVPYTLGDPVPNPAFPPEQLAFEDVNFSGGGSASEYRFEFAEPNNPRRPYSLNWDTVDRDGQKLPEGWYKLNIFDDSASSTGEIYFPPQVVYVYLTNN